jgi:hypothetical protein
MILGARRARVKLAKSFVDSLLQKIDDDIAERASNPAAARLHQGTAAAH